MKMFTVCLIACCPLLFSGLPGWAEDDAPYPVAWELTEGIESPESAYFDSDSGYVFLSQIGAGGPTGKDGDGRISKLSSDGRIVAARWITGLDAPKGLRSHGGRLWVSDIDHLVEIDIAEGRVVQRLAVKDAQFLNDVAIDADGTVFVSDTLSSKIHRYRDGQVDVFAAGEHLEYPNGLLVVNGSLLVAAWGRPNEDFSTEVPGRLFALDLDTGDKTLITPQPLGNLDGLERVAEGRHLVSDWNAGKIWYVTPTGEARLVLQLPKGAADIGYIADQQLLIVPQMLENRVTAFRLTQPEAAKPSGR
jgi:sugar lactone lactonase YvrE